MTTSGRGDPSDQAPPHSGQSTEAEELPYLVELWDETKQGVEQVLAVTAHASIGQAAFYAAAREFPDRYVTLRHKNEVINRWGGKPH